jgi:histidine triad (HIT) family protein
MSSIFTKVINGEIKAFKIAENDRFLAFLDVFPLAKGHTLIVPKQEIDYIFDIEDTMLADMTVFAKKVGLAIEKAIPCRRIGVAIIGLEVPHAHIHLIPLQTVQDINFTREKMKVSQEELEEISIKIKQFIS